MRKNTPTKAKVVAGAAGAGAGSVTAGFLVWCIDEAFLDGAGPAQVPGPVEAMVILLVTTIAAFAAGWIKTETVE
jgi:hypothetical protein